MFSGRRRCASTRPSASILMRIGGLDRPATSRAMLVTQTAPSPTASLGAQFPPPLVRHRTIASVRILPLIGSIRPTTSDSRASSPVTHTAPRPVATADQPPTGIVWVTAFDRGLIRSTPFESVTHTNPPPTATELIPLTG